MSSRLIPPNVGEIFFTVSMIDALSCVAKLIGNASISASPLNRIDFTSITAIAASGPTLPSPNTADPSVTTATLLARFVKANDSDLSLAMAILTAATPGVYAIDNSSAVSTFILEAILTLPLLALCRIIASAP